MTPISSPRFSNGKTCSTPSSAPSSWVRSAQTSTTVRMRPTGSRARAPPWSAVKQTTSQRPTPGWRAKGPASATSPGSEVSDGKRFSNTTTS